MQTVASAQDVKPENFLFGGQKEDILKLCDFGLALRQPKKGKKLSGVGGATKILWHSGGAEGWW